MRTVLQKYFGILWGDFLDKFAKEICANTDIGMDEYWNGRVLEFNPDFRQLPMINPARKDIEMDPKIYLLREFQEFELAEKWINAKAKDPDRYKLHSIIKHGGLLIVVLIYCADEPRNKREFERDLCDYLTTEKGRAIVHKLLFEALTNKEKQIQRTLENAEDLKSVGEEEV